MWEGSAFTSTHPSSTSSRIILHSTSIHGVFIIVESLTGNMRPLKLVVIQRGKGEGPWERKIRKKTKKIQGRNNWFLSEGNRSRVVSSSLELDIHRVWIQKGGGKCLSDRSHCTEIKRWGGVLGTASLTRTRIHQENSWKKHLQKYLGDYRGQGSHWPLEFIISFIGTRKPFGFSRNKMTCSELCLRNTELGDSVRSHLKLFLKSM